MPTKEEIKWIKSLYFPYDKYPDSGNLLIENKDITEKIVKASGKNAYFVLNETLPYVFYAGLIKDSESLKEYGLVLADIAKAAPGLLAQNILKQGLHDVFNAGLIKNTEDLKIIRDIIKASSKDYFWAILNDGLLAIAKAGLINSTEDLKVIRDIIKASGKESAKDILRFGLPAIVKIGLVKNTKDLLKVKDIIVELSKTHKDILQNSDLFVAFVEKRFEDENIDVAGFLKSHVKEKLGFVPSGDLEGLLKLAITDFKKREIRKINQVFSKKIRKVFPLGKVYGNLNVSGIVRLSDPVELVEVLVTVLLTPSKKGDKDLREMLKDPKYERYIRFLKTYSRAKSLFDFKKLQKARNYIKLSSLSVKKMFKDLKNDIALLKEHKDKEAAKRILNYFIDIAQKGRAEKIEPLSDILMGVKSLFGATLRFNHVIAKMQSGVVTDLFDSETTMCCAFYPSGAYAEFASFGYLEDANIGLLQIKAALKESALAKIKEIEIIGVAILVLCQDKEGKLVLLVDSVEGNSDYLGCMKDLEWKNLFFNAIKSIKKDVKAEYILFNSNVGNTTPERFNNFLLSAGYKMVEKPLMLTKLGSKDHRYLEAFGGWKVPKGLVSGIKVE